MISFPFPNNLIVLSQSRECGNNLQHSEISKWDYILSGVCAYTCVSLHGRILPGLPLKITETAIWRSTNIESNSVDRRCRCTRCSHAPHIPNRAGESSNNNLRVIISNWKTIADQNAACGKYLWFLLSFWGIFEEKMHFFFFKLLTEGL